MGLDAVELVMDVEYRFGVKLPDSECSKVRKVADLAALVTSRLPGQTGGCATAREFFALRKLMVEQGGLARRQVRPSTRLDALFTTTGGMRRDVWQRMREHNQRLPPLEVSRRIDNLALFISALAVFPGSIVCFLVVWTQPNLPWLEKMWITMSAAFLVIAAVILMRNRLCTEFPCRAKTVGDLARHLAPFEVPGDTPEQQQRAYTRVLEEIRRLTAQQMGLQLNEVQPESRFFEDLKMG